MKSQKSIVMIFILLSGMLFISIGTNNVSALGTLSADMKAGNTYFYNIDSFPSFQELLDLALSMAGDGGSGYNHSCQHNGRRPLQAVSPFCSGRAGHAGAPAG